MGIRCWGAAEGRWQGVRSRRTPTPRCFASRACRPTYLLAGAVPCVGVPLALPGQLGSLFRRVVVRRGPRAAAGAVSTHNIPRHAAGSTQCCLGAAGGVAAEWSIVSRSTQSRTGGEGSSRAGGKAEPQTGGGTPRQHVEPAAAADRELRACPMPCEAHRGPASACRGLRQGSGLQGRVQALADRVQRVLNAAKATGALPKRRGQRSPQSVSAHNNAQDGRLDGRIQAVALWQTGTTLSRPPGHFEDAC